VGGTHGRSTCGHQQRQRDYVVPRNHRYAHGCTCLVRVDVRLARRTRATDAAGNVQPVDQPWNYQGMENNMVQRVDVLVV